MQPNELFSLCRSAGAYALPTPSPASPEKVKRKVPPSCSRAEENARSLTVVGMT